PDTYPLSLHDALPISYRVSVPPPILRRPPPRKSKLPILLPLLHARKRACSRLPAMSRGGWLPAPRRRDDIHPPLEEVGRGGEGGDRKSTRLKSSHVRR